MKLYSLNHQGCPCLLRSGTKPVFNHSMLNHTVSAPSAGSSPTPPPTSNSSKSIQDVVEQLWRRTLLSAENPQQCFNPEEKNDDMIKIYFYSCLPWLPERSCKTWINHNTPIFKISQWLSILLEMEDILSIALFSNLILHLIPATHRTGFCFLKPYVLSLHRSWHMLCFSSLLLPS